MQEAVGNFTGSLAILGALAAKSRAAVGSSGCSTHLHVDYDQGRGLTTKKLTSAVTWLVSAGALSLGGLTCYQAFRVESTTQAVLRDTLKLFVDGFNGRALWFSTLSTRVDGGKADPGLLGGSGKTFSPSNRHGVHETSAAAGKESYEFGDITKTLDAKAKAAAWQDDAAWYRVRVELYFASTGCS